MLSEFLFEFLDGVGPVDRFGSLVVVRDVLVERAFEVAGAEKVIGLQVLALKQTKPDFELIEKGGHWAATRGSESAVALRMRVPAHGASLRAVWGHAWFHCPR